MGGFLRYADATRPRDPAGRAPLALAAALACALALACLLAGCSAASGGPSAETGGAGRSASDAAAAPEPEEEPGPEFVEATTGSGISYAGASSFAASDELAELEVLVADCEARGVSLSIVVRDLEGDVSLSYRPDTRAYSASAIKGPYAVFVYERLVGGGLVSEGAVRDLVASAVAYSDNEAYRQLREATYGMGWSSWLADAGVDVSGGRASLFDDYWYADVSARDLALMWEASWPYLSGGSEGARALAPSFAQTPNSAIRELLGETCPTWSKAGWFYSTDGNASPATNDAGIVEAESGAYVLAVVTSAPGDFELVGELVSTLAGCHEALAMERG